MSTQTARAARFRQLHQPGTPLLMPNAWDVGSAVLFATLGFEALATTSGGFAVTRGRHDGALSRTEVLAHVADLAGATDVPLSADLENCFAHDPDGVAATVTEAVACGVAGCSVEDFSGLADQPIYELDHAADRVRAAAEAAHAGPVPVVLTARAENYLRGRPDLGDTITRLQAYQDAGADVLFAPTVVDPADLRQLLGAVDRPVSVLVVPGAPTVGELAQLGVSRISVGGVIAVAAYGAAVQAVTELRTQGTCGYWDLADVARPVMAAGFTR
ncbi:MAG TPA: isocitrate lyase/phosphoenolpyruvate mutase family protein [Acidimicrobiales bacterium]|nr:isocitrate lyase/phosphoenolpyruvate mutase family protein [Acidimicrobiales bacterium]